MGDTTDGGDTGKLADRSRRVFTHGMAAVGLGLATGAAVPASSNEHETSGNETAADGDGSGETEAASDDGERTAIDSPTTIEEPGEYELVADVVPDTLEDGRCITVDLGERDDGTVTIYGNGHTIDLGRVEGGDGVVSNPEMRGDEGTGPGWTVDVHDLTVTGGNHAVVSNLDTGGSFTDVTVAGNDEGFRFHLDYGTVRNCVLAENTTGASLSGSEIHGGAEIDFDHCTVRDNDAEGIRVVQGTATVTASRVVGNATGVYVAAPDGDADVQGSHICGNTEYGVDAESGTDDETGEGDLPGGATAIDNYWGASNGPSSYGDPEDPYEDPETGRPADGDGDAIPEGLEDGVSNVRFDPFRESTIEGVGADR